MDIVVTLDSDIFTLKVSDIQFVCLATCLVKSLKYISSESVAAAVFAQFLKFLLLSSLTFCGSFLYLRGLIVIQCLDTSCV